MIDFAIQNAEVITPSYIGGTVSVRFDLVNVGTQAVSELVGVGTIFDRVASNPNFVEARFGQANSAPSLFVGESVTFVAAVERLPQTPGIYEINIVTNYATGDLEDTETRSERNGLIQTRRFEDEENLTNNFVAVEFYVGPQTSLFTELNDIETLPGAGTFDGLAGDDDITGSDEAETIFGGAGNDRIRANGGDDTLYGGSGIELLDGGEGDDLFILSQSFSDVFVLGMQTVRGGAGNDRIDAGNVFVEGYDISGGDGIDVVDFTNSSTGVLVNLSAGPGAADNNIFTFNDDIEIFIGSAFDDRFTGRADRDDFFRGGAGDDDLSGGKGNDYLDGNDGDDWLRGGDDDDVLRGGAGADLLHGNNGIDTADYSDNDKFLRADLADVSMNAGIASGDTYVGIENLLGSRFSEAFRGDSRDNRIDGRDGEDFLFGRDGDDFLIGGGGNDRLFGEAGNDLISGGNRSDFINGGDGDDVIRGGSGADNMRGLTGRDTFVFFDGDGRDVIRDFISGDDVMRFVGTGLTFEELTISDRSFGALVEYGTGKINVENVDAASLTADDFFFAG